ncbi:MAG TPA: hypothetical protein VI461_07935, partial [Chitinophagaceae bacterium]|nr:hypothetical protein [Chitinophagaceae bacterium]
MQKLNLFKKENDEEIYSFFACHLSASLFICVHNSTGILLFLLKCIYLVFDYVENFSGRRLISKRLW